MVRPAQFHPQEGNGNVDGVWTEPRFTGRMAARCPAGCLDVTWLTSLGSSQMSSLGPPKQLISFPIGTRREDSTGPCLLEHLCGRPFAVALASFLYWQSQGHKRLCLATDPSLSPTPITLSSNLPLFPGLTVPLTQGDPQPQFCPLTYAVVPGHLGLFKSWVCLSPLHFSCLSFL